MTASKLMRIKIDELMQMLPPVETLRWVSRIHRDQVSIRVIRLTLDPGLPPCWCFERHLWRAEPLPFVTIVM